MATTAPPPQAAGGPSPAPGPTKSNASALRTNLTYLVKGSAGASAVAPKAWTTRTGLSTLRYTLKFVFWRLVRYFKYSLIAAGSAALAGTIIGPMVPIVGALAVPSIPVAAGIGLTTAVIKFGWRHRGNHFRSGWLASGEGRDARLDEQRDAQDAADDFNEPVRRRQHRAEHAWGSQADFS
ncbi:hypothetical protein OIO90_002701 [Microbotryomycetes sp. JL221]|nr:hypothetical protein OIO90_002701 [Microbotryomycetes sp. JL221]